MPERIQRRRVNGWRLPAGAVVVTRPTKWGNPYLRSGADGASPVELFRSWLTRTGSGARLVEAARTELAGKDLACWCALDKPCHADVLLEIANGGAR